jgi:putative oxidoreductase
MQGLYPGDASIWDSVGRLLIGGFFVVLLIRNLMPHQIADHIERLQAFGCPLPRQAFWAGVLLEGVGCALVLFNWYPAVGVVCLMAFTVLATLLLLRFWEVDDPGKRTGMQNGFFANFAILGGLVLLLQRVA